MKVNDRIRDLPLNTFAPLEILQSLGDAVSIQDPDFRILYQNQAQKDLNSSHKGEYCYHAYARRDSICEGCPVAMSFRDGKIHKTEMNTSDEKLKVEITASALRDPAGNIIACVEVVRDITERKLADNALKSFDPRRPGIIRISGNKEKDHSVYCIEDNGVGIAVEHQEEIFDMFKQLEPSRCRGEGLGLTIVRKSIERHNGKIWLESEPGKGSRFFVSLPA